MDDINYRTYSLTRALDNYATLKWTKKQFYKCLTSKDNYFECYKDLDRDIAKAEKLRAMTLRDRDLQVIYITGQSGSGKTLIAKYISQKAGYDPFVSGSGDDILDGYDKEECIILDDFRAGTMKFNEVLKFIDNNTGSSVKSRYFNKDINNCKLLIITSVQQPNELYSFFKTDDNKQIDNKDEPITQFYRRLGFHYLTVQGSEWSDKTQNYLTDTYIDPKTNAINDVKILAKISNIYEELGIPLDNNERHKPKNDILKGIFGEKKQN